MSSSDQSDPDPARNKKRQTLILVGIIIFVVGSYVGFKFGERHAEAVSPNTQGDPTLPQSNKSTP